MTNDARDKYMEERVARLVREEDANTSYWYSRISTSSDADSRPYLTYNKGWIGYSRRETNFRGEKSMSYIGFIFKPVGVRGSYEGDAFAVKDFTKVSASNTRDIDRRDKTDFVLAMNRNEAEDYLLSLVKNEREEEVSIFRGRGCAITLDDDLQEGVE